MRHTSRRRAFVDPLLPQPSITWLVVRDRTSLALKSRELEPGADLHAVIATGAVILGDMPEPAAELTSSRPAPREARLEVLELLRVRVRTVE
jgi:hypothetical protein